MIKTLIFDFDGTLADTFSIVLESANRVIKKFGYAPVKDTPKLRSKSMKQIIKDRKIPVHRFTSNN
ncbi:MAG: HAD hydrolase-like protein [Nanoarchaeota archaeon]